MHLTIFKSFHEKRFSKHSQFHFWCKNFQLFAGLKKYTRSRKIVFFVQKCHFYEIGEVSIFNQKKNTNPLKIEHAEKFAERFNFPRKIKPLKKEKLQKIWICFTKSHILKNKIKVYNSQNHIRRIFLSWVNFLKVFSGHIFSPDPIFLLKLACANHNVWIHKSLKN